MKINVAVFFGCRSVEHEVSIISAVQAMRSMDKEKYNILPVYVTKDGEMFTGKHLFNIESYRDLASLYKKSTPVFLIRKGGKVFLKEYGGVFKSKETLIDVAFPIVHGTNCEDGTIQGYFEFLGVPYVGSDIISSAVGMDKAVFKDVLKRYNLPVLDCVTFTSEEYNINGDAVCKNLIGKIGFPMIIKPVNSGSSVGITKVKNEAELFEAIAEAVNYASVILAEHAIENLREINCSVLGDSEDAKPSVLEEPFMKDEILSYKDKYLSSSKSKTGGSKGMASLDRKIPADLDKDATEEIRNLAVAVFKALGCSGVVRIDFMIDKDTDAVYVNEINTIPGSLSFYLWDKTDLPYKDLLDNMIAGAFSRARKRKALSFSFETNILEGVSFGSKTSKNGKL